MVRNLQLVLALLCCTWGMLFSQEAAPERYLEVRGIAEFDMQPLSQVTANLYDGSNLVKSAKTGSDGRFSFKLEPNKQYTIEIEKDGMVSKRISFDTRMPDEEKGTWMNEFSMGLVKPCSGVDYSVLKEPVDKVSFDAKRREFISDKSYVNNMRSRMERMMIENDQCHLNNYESLVKKADQLASQKKFEEATGIYRQALEIYPTEDYPARKITEMSALMNKQQLAAGAYQEVIAQADALAAQQNFEQALQKYNQAATLNPQENYPRQKAAEIEKNLAQQQAAKQALLNTEEKYNQAMAKASVAYTRKDYATAKQFYQEALSVKPSEALPKTRMQEVETILEKKAAEEAARAEQLAQKEAFEKEYAAQVMEADQLFKAKKYDEAKAAYAKAINMKPGESYPAQRIKTIDNAVATEQAAMQKSMESGYAAAMAAANTALAQNQFALARESLQKALTFKPDDLAAKSQLANVDNNEEAFNRDKALNDQYANVIKTADGLMAAKEWQKARESYTQALTLKPGDAYAQTRVKAIDNTVAAEQAALQKAQNDSYDAAMAAGNNALVQNQFQQAKASFQQALTIKPNDAIARARIAETDRLADQFAKNKAIDEQYQQAIKTADDLMAANKLSDARAGYLGALRLKPGDQYAQARVTSIDNAIAAEQAARLKATEEGYKAAIGAANTAIMQKAYAQAKEFLQKALEIKPGDAFAMGKSAEVDRLLAEQQKMLEKEQLLAKQYATLIASADKSFNARDYTSARSAYINARQLKPADPYASQQILEIDNLLAAEKARKQKEIDDAYANAMGKGSGALSVKDYKTAQEAFQQALTHKPGDVQASAKLSETTQLIKQEQDRLLAVQARKRIYDETIRTADQQLTQQQFAVAKLSYEKAIEMMPGESYPRQKLDEVIKSIAEQERIAADNKAKDNAYALALVNADKYFKAKDYVQARDEYSRALNIKPNETLPKTRLAEMERLIAQQQQEQEVARSRAAAYSAAINAGNDAFGKKDYSSARGFYTEALKQMPGDLLATDQIKKIDYLVAEAERVKKVEQERKAAFDALIAAADKTFETGNYPSAKESYKKALVIDPNSAYAKQRIIRIDEILRALASSQTKPAASAAPSASKVTAAIPMGDLNFRNESERQLYLDELKKKYPAGVTLEKYKEKTREIYRYIIIREDIQEFRHIKYLNFTGNQYSVNGKPITLQYFQTQVKVRDGENFREIDMQ